MKNTEEVNDQKRRWAGTWQERRGKDSPEAWPDSILQQRLKGKIPAPCKGPPPSPLLKKTYRKKDKSYRMRLSRPTLSSKQSLSILCVPGPGLGGREGGVGYVSKQ